MDISDYPRQTLLRNLWLAYPPLHGLFWAVFYPLFIVSMLALFKVTGQRAMFLEPFPPRVITMALVGLGYGALATYVPLLPGRGNVVNMFSHAYQGLVIGMAMQAILVRSGDVAHHLPLTGMMFVLGATIWLTSGKQRHNGRSRLLMPEILLARGGWTGARIWLWPLVILLADVVPALTGHTLEAVFLASIAFALMPCMRQVNPDHQNPAHARLAQGLWWVAFTGLVGAGVFLLYAGR